MAGQQVPEPQRVGEAFWRTYATVARLRAPDGCPWDRQQTHTSLRPFLMEEAYEVLEALERAEEDPEHLKEELGDLLFQVLIHSVIAAERGAFHIADVLDALTEKLIRRHPHVFGGARVQDAQEVLRRWDEIKRREAGQEDGSLMAGLPGTLPPLRAAHRVQEQAARVGFDWPDAEEAMAKVAEELEELRAARRSGRLDQVEREAGDLLFAAVNVVRLCGVNPEVALAGAVRRFVARFREMERRARSAGLKLEEMDLEAMDRLWRETKQHMP